MWWAVYFALIFGFMAGAWCNGEGSRDRGERWGKATREWLGLPPIKSNESPQDGE